MSVVLSKIKIILEMIKFEHTIFALPFAFTGALLALDGLPSLEQVIWIIAAMVGARSAAMGFNRWADRDIDSENPRTKTRALPLGLVTPAQVLAFIVVSSGLLVLAAYMLNPLSFTLAPVALAIVFFYSYTKRFTFLSHAFLGLAISGAPMGAWIAVTGRFESASLCCSGSWASTSCMRSRTWSSTRRRDCTPFPSGSGSGPRS
ncbi:MAG: ubiA [Nitrospirae bacterium]|nr:ubiA [Nitrospirota bacterium]